MTDPQHDRPEDAVEGVTPRASLRGMGWEILRGEAPPEDYLTAAGAEPDSDLEAPLLAEVFPGTSPIALDHPAAPEYSKLFGQDTPTHMPRLERQVGVGEAAVLPGVPLEYEATPRIESALRGNPPVLPAYEPREGVALLVPEMPESLERPASPSMIPGVLPEDAAEGALLELDSVPAGPAPTVPRPDASDLFGGQKDIPPADDLLDRFVTDERLEQLWHEVEALQVELAEATGGNRARFDTYQKEVLQAFTLLLQNKANYDDVRAIVYRIRGELRQDQQVSADITRYRPRLLVFFVVALAGWAGLMLLEPVFGRLVTDSLGLQLLGLMYHPTLFGMLGAILNGYFTLNKHTIQQRDFDASHMSWYLMNPVIGAIMGLLMTLLFGTGIVSTVGINVFEQATAGQYPFLLWVLCFLAGYNQNVVMRLLAWTFNQLRGADDAEPASGEADSPLN